MIYSSPVVARSEGVGLKLKRERKQQGLLDAPCVCMCVCIYAGRYLRVLGSNGTILALGDASSIDGIKIPTTGQVQYPRALCPWAFVVCSSRTWDMSLEPMIDRLVAEY